MKRHSIIFLSILSIFVLTAIGCNNDLTMEDPGGDPGGLTFEEVIASGGNIGEPTRSSSTDTTAQQNNLPIGSGTYNCTTVTYSVSAESGGDSGFPLFNPGADVIYPGSMLQGNSLHKATPDPIVVERAGGTISTTIIDGNLQSFFEVEQVTNSSITDGMNNIIANATGTLPAGFDLRVQNIQSREQFALALNVDVNSAFLDIETKLNYNADTERSTFLVSLNQHYYTMKFDLPTSLDQLFAPSVTPRQLANYVGENNPATYISQVNYGRIFYLLIESTSSITEMGLAVDGAFRGVTVDVDATLNISRLNELDDITINAFAYGGDAGPSFAALNASNLEELIPHLSASSTLGSARPLSYVVRNVADNRIVSTQLTTQYEVVECEQISNVGTLPSVLHWTNHPLLADFGPITAAYADDNNHFILVNNEGRWLRSSIDDEGNGLLEGPYNLEGLPFTEVGAACRLRGPGQNLYVFNRLGNRYAVLGTDGNWSPTFDITAFFGGDLPFATAGVGAVAFQGEDAHLMFDQLGTSHARGNWVSLPGFGHYPGGVNTGLGFLGNKLNGVGAALGFQQGNTGVSIFFDLSGTQYVVHGDFGSGYEARGPFSL